MGQTTNIRVAWAALAVLAGGCTTRVSFGENYHLVCSTPGELQCAGNTAQSCVDGTWQDQMVCTGQTCVSGACVGVCEPGAVQCAGNTPRSCDGGGNWQSGLACVSGMCNAGQCISGPSCAGLPATCGATANENCCASAVVVGGTYNRSNDAMYPGNGA